MFCCGPKKPRDATNKSRNDSNKSRNDTASEQESNKSHKNSKSSRKGSNKGDKGVFQRLPGNAKPVRYSITIKPNFEDFTFEGSASIDIKLYEDSYEIVLNAAELTIGTATSIQISTGDQTAATISINASTEVATLTFQRELKAGRVNLLLEFSGSIGEKMRGFYRCKDKVEHGHAIYNGITQFEAIDARRCFPCWDEPAHKAVFDIRLVVDKNKTALSNMPMKETVPYAEDSNLQIVSFHSSPIMSTYLVAFIIGDFEYIETKSKDGVLCRVYTPPGKKEQATFALEIVAKMLPFYKEYFGIQYPLPKLDLVAVANFDSAMENWGLIIFREASLLVDAAETTAINRQWVALVVGHEISHQWFGNLVTMEWWSDLWLKEGFSNFMENICVDFLFPEFDIWTNFMEETHRALELDSLQSSHPIEVPILHPADIDELFDEISYNKGACVTHMIYHYIGENDFKKGVQIYLTSHQYKNTCTEDLWKALEQASGKPVHKVMGTWTNQMGFPVIHVKSEVSGGKQRIHLTQEKFTVDPALKGSKENKAYHWMIPISFCTASNPKGPIGVTLLENKTATITLPDIKKDEWVKLNPGSFGFYRVQYSEEMLKQFIPAIKNKSLLPLDRVEILDDIFAMVKMGESSTVDVLKLLESFREEDSYAVWCVISDIMEKMDLLLEYTDYHDKFTAFGRHLFGPVLKKVGWGHSNEKSSSHFETLLRALIILKMIKLDDIETIEEAKKRFNYHINSEKHIPADLRTAVYQAVLSEGDEEKLMKLIQLYRESNISEEKNRIGKALGGYKNVEVQKKVIDFAMSEHVMAQDTRCIMAAVAMDKEGRVLTWNYIKNNVKLFRDRYPNGKMTSRLIKSVTRHFVTEDMACEVNDFFRENPIFGTERAILQAVESIRINERWLKQDGTSVGEYLTSLQYA